MNFSFLEDAHQTWQDICVIGKTIEREEGNCHIVGMTLSDAVKLYVIEPYDRSKSTDRPGKGIRTQRRILRENEETEDSYLHCSDFYFGKKRLQVQSGSGESLEYSEQNYVTLQLFMEMISAGWHIPKWLKDADWNDLMLITLCMRDDVKKLPKYTTDMPITICHGQSCRKHLLEKTVTLQIGKSRSFSFTDHVGDIVKCYVNKVSLIDVWEDMEKQWSDPKLVEKFSPEQLRQARKCGRDALEQNVPKGMCYIGVEYECTKDIHLSFYAKQFLGSRPETHRGSSSFLLVRLKPDRQTGTHHLPLKGCMIQTPVSPDTTVVPAEAFLYMEKIDGWTETI